MFTRHLLSRIILQYAAVFQPRILPPCPSGEQYNTKQTLGLHKGDGLYENGFACGQAMALQFGLVAESEVPAVRRRLVEAVHAEDDKIDFGLLGSTVVFRALSEAGETDLAWKMIMNDTYPGFAHWIKEGATTL